MPGLSSQRLRCGAGGMVYGAGAGAGADAGVVAGRHAAASGEPPAHHPILPQHRLPGENLYAVSANTAQPAKNRAVPELLREVLKG